MLVANIKCGDRTEKQMVVWSSKKEKFSWNNKTYVLDPECVYRGKYFGFNMAMADYIQGMEKPLNYFDGALKVSDKAKDPDKVGALISRIDMSPNFERNLFMLVAVNVVLTLFMIVTNLRGAVS